MAGGMDLGQSGKGGKKPLDTAINLVPFIDLMAVTISFLIYTAVWTQVGRLQVSSAGNTSDPQEQKDDKTPPLVLMLTNQALQLSVGPSQQEAIQLTRDPAGKIDLSKLAVQVKNVKGQFQEESNITLQTADDVKYDDLVRVIDEMIGDGLPNVSVSPINS
jgi:biopolymer transport protein TolR